MYVELYRFFHKAYNKVIQIKWIVVFCCLQISKIFYMDNTCNICRRKTWQVFTSSSDATSNSSSHFCFISVNLIFLILTQYHSIIQFAILISMLGPRLLFTRYLDSPLCEHEFLLKPKKRKKTERREWVINCIIHPLPGLL